MQNIQRSLVDRRSLNGLQVIRLHYNTADDIQKYMTVIRESIKVIEIGLVVDKSTLALCSFGSSAEYQPEPEPEQNQNLRAVTFL